MKASPARALGISALVVIPILALFDVISVPRRALTQSGFDLLALVALSVKGHVMLLLSFLGVQGAFALGAAAGETRPDVRRWTPLLAVGAGLLCAFQSHLVLLDYERFRGHVPFIAAWLGLGVYLALTYWMMVKRRSRRALLAIAAIGFAGAAVAAWANATQYPGTYPSLHRSLTSVAYLLGHAGLALTLVSRQPRAHTAARTWAPVAVAALLVIPMLGARLASARAVTLHRNFTSLGRAAVTDALGVAETCVAPLPNMDPVAAREVFARYSRMPALPPTFRLTDYNVLLVTIDTVRHDDAFRAGAAPNLARLVQRGAFAFDDAMSPSAGTTQSIASLLALTYPTHTPMEIQSPRFMGELRPAAQTIAEIFKESGYTTFAGIHGAVPWVLRGGEQGFDHLWIPHGYDETKTSDQELTAWTIDALDRMKSEGNRFFGWVFFLSPHAPYLERGAPTPSARDRYRQEIEFADAQLGLVIDHLEASGQLDTTIIIVMGDHGEEFGEHGQAQHSVNLYTESLHIPLVVRLPPLKGSWVKGVTSALYVFPWLLSAGDAKMVSAADRVLTSDLGPVLKAVDGAVVAEMLGVDRLLVALIWDERKIIHGGFSNYVQMYDRRTDRGEQRDLAMVDFPFKNEVDALGRYHALRVCKQRAVETGRRYVPPDNTTRREDIRLR